VHTFNTLDKTKVVIYNPLGSVDLHAAGTGTATVELDARGDDDSILDDATVTCTETNGTSIVTITLPNPKSFSRRRGGIDVRVTAPEGCDVSISSSGPERSLLMLTRGDGGDLRLHGSVGDVDVSIPSADLSAQVVQGSLSYKTASGDLDVDSVRGPVKVRSASGDVSIEETGGEHVDVTSVSGDVTITDAHDGASAKSTSGDTVVRRAWRGTVRAATVSGDVEIGVPSGRAVSVDARSISGTLSSEIDLSGDRDERSDSTDVVRITATSVSGDVEILRASTTTAAS
jgi:hypothetical protein